MSKDIRLTWECPHIIKNESTALSTDRTSLITSKPIASSTVRITANDDTAIPQAGLYTMGHLTSNFRGPYTLRENEDVFEVESSQGTQTVTFEIKGVVRWSADKVLKYLKQQLSVVLVENSDSLLVLTDISNVGQQSYVKVGGSAASALGFGSSADCRNDLPYRANGRMVYPPWKLYSPPGVIVTAVVSTRYPKFLLPLQASPVFKITYTTYPQKCSRCGASLYENDYRFDDNGQALMVENENLLYQAALKILLTIKGSNPYAPFYGTTIQSRIGSKALAGITAVLNEEVRQALGKYKDLQEAQSQYQIVTFAERLYSINSVNVFQSDTDATVFMIEVSVTSGSKKPINVSVMYRATGSYDQQGQQTNSPVAVG